MRLMFFFFFFNDTATTEIYTLSLHDALPICRVGVRASIWELAPASVFILRGLQCIHERCAFRSGGVSIRSEEHTSELQSPCNRVCRLLLEKKKFPIAYSKRLSALHLLQQD